MHCLLEANNTLLHYQNFQVYYIEILYFISNDFWGGNSRGVFIIFIWQNKDMIKYQDFIQSSFHYFASDLLIF